MRYLRRRKFMWIVLMALTAATSAEVPEHLYTGDLVSFPGPWAFQLGKQHIILVNDQQLDDLTDPDKQVDLSLTGEPRMESLRQICDRAEQNGQRTLIFAYDHFFNQYRKGTDTAPRQYVPDTDAYIERIGKIGRFAAEHGIGLELSLLSPLELGRGYREATGESGQWMHYRKGLRDPETGAYSVALWQQRRWSNNKGPITLEDAGVRVFAFRERSLGGSPYIFVDPADIVEITDTAAVERFDGLVHKAGDFEAVRIRVHGTGHTELGPLDRVFVVQQYRTPELDYFSAKALPFLKDLVDRYTAAGVKLNGLYSDEMHIQQDWSYFSHHDHGQFAVRYVTQALADRYAELYGSQYRDFAKYLIYFAYGQEDTAGDLTATLGEMHVFGDSPRAIRETALFRARYYHLLQNTVVDLFADAKHYAEEKMGYRLEARAHATWAQSPTIDKWDTPGAPQQQNQYEYTSNFIWSNTVQQASAACYDYFKWGDFLTGNGNDHAEGGWLDRDYYGLMLACSIGVINDVPYAYGAHWGMPGELHRRRQAVADVFGASSTPQHGLVQELQHRDTEVLMLYPIDLVAAEERFGSWMTQYAYANLITQEKLLELGTVTDGKLTVAGRTYSTLVALFEPFPSERLLAMMQAMADQGGKVIWSGPPPVVAWEGGDALASWQALTGVQYRAERNEGIAAPSKTVNFEGPLAGVSSQTIPTHFMVDRIYPLTPQEGVVPVAQVGSQIVGTLRTTAAGGQVLALGFRPRDDQSQSLGSDVRTWFEVLRALGCYAPTGSFADFNDNTDVLARDGDYMVCRFPNGTIALAPHLRRTLEEWPGGFARNAKEDQAYLDRVPPPSEHVSLADYRVNGHSVRYEGESTLSFRMGADNTLLAFAGQGMQGITVDGREYRFADAPLGQLAFAPVGEARRVPGGAIMQLLVSGQGEVRLPAAGLPEAVSLIAQGAKPGSRGEEVAARVEAGVLIFDAGAAAGRWLFVVPKENATP